MVLGLQCAASHGRRRALSLLATIDVAGLNDFGTGCQGQRSAYCSTAWATHNLVGFMSGGAEEQPAPPPMLDCARAR